MVGAYIPGRTSWMQQLEHIDLLVMILPVGVQRCCVPAIYSCPTKNIVLVATFIEHHPPSNDTTQSAVIVDIGYSDGDLLILTHGELAHLIINCLKTNLKSFC